MSFHCSFPRFAFLTIHQTCVCVCVRHQHHYEFRGFSPNFACSTVWPEKNRFMSITKLISFLGGPPGRFLWTFFFQNELPRGTNFSKKKKKEKQQNTWTTSEGEKLSIEVKQMVEHKEIAPVELSAVAPFEWYLTGHFAGSWQNFIVSLATCRCETRLHYVFTYINRKCT